MVGSITCYDEKAMLSQTNMTDEAVSVVVANDGQGIIMIDNFAQLNENCLDGLYRILPRHVGTTGRVSNPGVVISEMAEANLQGMIYYIKHFKKTGSTYTHADVDITKVCAMYHHKDMEESQNEPEVVLSVNTKECLKNLEIGEEHII